MTTHDRPRPRRFAGLAVLALLTCSLLLTSGAGAAARLPSACMLLKRTEAKALAGVDVQPAVPTRSSCTYNGYPTGPVAQAAIYVDSTVPRTLTIDRSLLHHKLWRVRGLGDQALEEEWNIFVRKGTVWITVHLVRSDLWSADYQRRLEHAARIAIGRVRSPLRTLAGRSALGSVEGSSPSARGGREVWHGSERRFGGSITTYKGVVYRPGVVLIGGGASAVRSRSTDGLTWTIDARAPGASDLRVGSVMLATTFASGRVLKLTPAGATLRVVLGPVALTDVIQDGEFSSNGPVAIRSPLRYETMLPRPPAKHHRRLQGAASLEDAPSFTTQPICCENGLGVRIQHNGANGWIRASAQLYLKHPPSIEFHIRVGGGHLLEASVWLSGAGGLRVDFSGHTDKVAGNVNPEPTEAEQSLSVPLVGPLALTLTQSFRISMQLAGQAQLDTSGVYPIVGRIGFGHGVAAQAPTMTTKQPFNKSTLSLSVGTNAMSFGWKLRATVGIGVGGFTAGAWYAIDTGVSVLADGSHLQSLKFGCVTEAIVVNGAYGVGYTIPDFVRDVVNTFLHAIHAKEIKAAGGPQLGQHAIFHPPANEYCPPRK